MSTIQSWKLFLSSYECCIYDLAMEYADRYRTRSLYIPSKPTHLSQIELPSLCWGVRWNALFYTLETMSQHAPDHQSPTNSPIANLWIIIGLISHLLDDTCLSEPSFVLPISCLYRFISMMSSTLWSALMFYRMYTWSGFLQTILQQRVGELAKLCSKTVNEYCCPFHLNILTLSLLPFC